MTRKKSYVIYKKPRGLWWLWTTLKGHSSRRRRRNLFDSTKE